MPPILLAAPEHRWECPNCTQTHVTRETRPHTPMHTCPGLRGLSAPFIVAGTKADVRAVVREDYLNGDTQTVDENGRPIASIIRVRDDGTDVWAQAGHATVNSTSI